MILSTKRGFTLIELLVVIAIIALLSSLVFASLSTARAKSRDARRIADLRQIQTALEMYFDTNNVYPSIGITSYIAPLPQMQFTSTTSALYTALVPSYIATLPNDPLIASYTGLNNFTYRYCPNYIRPTTTMGCDSSTASATFYLLTATLELANNSAAINDANQANITGFVATTSNCRSTGSASDQCVGLTSP